jgi:hypothetical protein
MMRKFIKNLLTEADGRTWDVFRIAFLFGVLSFLTFAAWAVFQTGAFDMTSFGMGFSSMFAAGGAGVGVKSKLEGPATDVQKDGEM